MEKPPCLFHQKGVIKMRQVAKTHATHHFGLSQFTSPDPMNFPPISPLPPPKLPYHHFNVITKPQWQFERSHHICRDGLDHGFN